MKSSCLTWVRRCGLRIERINGSSLCIIKNCTHSCRASAAVKFTRESYRCICCDEIALEPYIRSGSPTVASSQSHERVYTGGAWETTCVCKYSLLLCVCEARRVTFTCVLQPSCLCLVALQSSKSSFTSLRSCLCWIWPVVCGAKPVLGSRIHRLGVGTAW